MLGDAGRSEQVAGLRLDCRVLSQTRCVASAAFAPQRPSQSRAARAPRPLAVGGSGGLDARAGLPGRLGGPVVQRAAGAPARSWSASPTSRAARRRQVATPDLSLWDLERIADWRSSLEQEAPPPLAVLRIPKIQPRGGGAAGHRRLRAQSRAWVTSTGTALPGTDGNSAIAGHRDGFFRGLKDVGPGDAIEVETLGGNEVYRIERMLGGRPGRRVGARRHAGALDHAGHLLPLLLRRLGARTGTSSAPCSPTTRRSPPERVAPRDGSGWRRTGDHVCSGRPTPPSGAWGFANVG